MSNAKQGKPDKIQLAKTEKLADFDKRYAVGELLGEGTLVKNRFCVSF